MALFQPTNIIPSTLSGEGNGTVDVTQPLTVSWQVNGNSPMVAYRIKIMQNDTESTLKLDTGKVSLPSPFFGTDRLGNPRNYTVILPAAQLATAGIINGYANGYKLNIQQWWTADDSIEQTSASFFITRNAPTVTLQTIPYRNDFRQLAHTFEAFYSQAQDDAVEWAHWELQAFGNGEYETIDDTGYIYNSGLEYESFYSKLQYSYNGFIPGLYNPETGDNTGVQYRIRCTVQTENGVQASTGWKEFTTQYLGNHQYDAPLRMCVANDRDAVKIQFPVNFPMIGVTDGAYSYEAGTTRFRLNLEAGSSVTWGGAEGMTDIKKPPYTIMLKSIISDVSSPVTFFSAEYEAGILSFAYNENGFYVELNGDVIWENNVAPISSATLGIAITSESVYFLMKNGTEISSSEADIPAWQGSRMKSITISGPMIFDSVEVFSGNRIWFFFYTSIVSDYYAASMEDDTLFIAAFDHTTFSGDTLIGASGTGRNGNPAVLTTDLCICRKAKSSSIFELVATIPLNENTHNTVLYDYSAKNQEEYQYYMLYMWGWNYIRSAGSISPVTPCWWNYTVLCCSQNNNGDYIVESEYRFALDVSSGNVGNNNSPALQKNFTRYPLRQPVSGNYRSGSLGAFIGKVENDQYVDTTDLMDELYNLSTNGLTKFLKTRKGQIFQIETSAPVVMQIGDKYAQQPAKITLPWVEVGDASGANILGDSSMIIDAPTFAVNPETMELTMNYNPASAMGQDSFLLTGGNLYLLDPGMYDEGDFSLNGNKEVILNTNSGGEG